MILGGLKAIQNILKGTSMKLGYKRTTLRHGVSAKNRIS